MNKTVRDSGEPALAGSPICICKYAPFSNLAVVYHKEYLFSTFLCETLKQKRLTETDVFEANCMEASDTTAGPYPYEYAARSAAPTEYRTVTAGLEGSKMTPYCRAAYRPPHRRGTWTPEQRYRPGTQSDPPPASGIFP